MLTQLILSLMPVTQVCVCARARVCVLQRVASYLLCLWLKCVCVFFREQLQASEDRYQAQKRVTQALEAEILKMYSQLEMERLTNHNRDHASNHLSGPNQTDGHSPTKTR